MVEALKVAGVCPKGCGATLMLGSGGHVVCSWLSCPDPCAADKYLHGEVADLLPVVKAARWCARDATTETLAGFGHVRPSFIRDLVAAVAALDAVEAMREAVTLCRRCGQALSGDTWHHAPPAEPRCTACLDHRFQPEPKEATNDGNRV